MIKQASQLYKKSQAAIFLDEWGSLGRKRPTCRTLLDLLIQAELFRAADYLAVDVLKSKCNLGMGGRGMISESQYVYARI